MVLPKKREAQSADVLPFPKAAAVQVEAQTRRAFEKFFLEPLSVFHPDIQATDWTVEVPVGKTYLGSIPVASPLASFYPLGFQQAQSPEVLELRRDLDGARTEISRVVARLSVVESALFARTFPAALNTLSNPRLELRKPILVSLDPDEDGYVVARWTEALLEGEGKTQPDALKDLGEQIVDAFEDLQDAKVSGVEVVGQAQALWELLTEFVLPRVAAAK